MLSTPPKNELHNRKKEIGFGIVTKRVNKERLTILVSIVHGYNQLGRDYEKLFVGSRWFQLVGKSTARDMIHGEAPLHNHQLTLYLSSAFVVGFPPEFLGVKKANLGTSDQQALPRVHMFRVSCVSFISRINLPKKPVPGGPISSRAHNNDFYVLLLFVVYLVVKYLLILLVCFCGRES
jgi:hypothetical protein